MLKHLVEVYEPKHSRRFVKLFQCWTAKEAMEQMVDWLIKEKVNPLETQFVDVEIIYEDDYVFHDVGGL